MIEGNDRILYSFKNNYSINKPLDIKTLYENPNREKYGYLWEDIYTRLILQTAKYRKNYKLSGFYINDKSNYRIVLGLLARNFQLTLHLKYSEWKKIPINRTQDKILWDKFLKFFNEFLNDYYLRLKKYFIEKEPNRCWINLSEFDINQKDPIYYDFLCGLESIEINTKKAKCFTNSLWKKTIEDGILENVGLNIFEDFLFEFPQTIEYAPKNIKIKLDSDIMMINDMNEFGYF